MMGKAAYNILRDQVADEFSPPKTVSWAGTARKWRRKVGIPRLTAERAAYKALELLKATPIATYRNNPELAALLREARVAVERYYRAVSEDGWKKVRS